jgi:hypothetical protein
MISVQSSRPRASESLRAGEPAGDAILAKEQHDSAMEIVPDYSPVWFWNDFLGPFVYLDLNNTNLLVLI